MFQALFGDKKGKSGEDDDMKSLVRENKAGAAMVYIVSFLYVICCYT